MSTENNIQTNVIEVLDSDKIQCECGKLILKKSMPSHLKTMLHTKGLNKPTPSDDGQTGTQNVSPTVEDSQKSPSNNKIKQEFVNIHEKLDLLIAMVDELISIEYDDDEDLSNELNLKK
jgi:hypothetical protein